MIPAVDLVLATLERALAVTVLPSLGNASAKEEVSIGILMARWLRDVIDHAVDAERASARDCRAVLEDVVATLAARGSGAAGAEVVAEARAALASERAERIAAARDEARLMKGLLSRALSAARTDGDGATAETIRRLLADLAGREIERELAFHRASGIDPDAATVRPLSEILENGRSKR